MRSEASIGCLPPYSRATQELESDTVLTEALGTMLADSYIAIRRADWEIFSQQNDEFEIRNHFYKY